MSDVVVPAESVFYVTGAMNRAIEAVRRDIAKAEKYLENLESRTDVDDEIKEDLISSSRFIIEYNRQWLREAEQAFAKCPDKLWERSNG